MNRQRRSRGAAMFPVLLVALVLLALGGFNYQRNWQAEKASSRTSPFSRYATGDLEKLQAAYRGELEDFQRRYQAGQQRRQPASGEGMLAERLEEFERIRREGDALRELNTELAQREARLREVEAELAQRRSLVHGWMLHLERLTRI